MPSHHLPSYRSTKACLIWILGFFSLYAILRRYDVYILIPGDHYLAGILTRLWEGYLYGFITAAFLGCLTYALFLYFFILRLYKKKPYFFHTATGIPRDFSCDGFITEGGYDLSVSPIQTAAALFPGLGFLGTVIGISTAIGGVEDVLNGGSPTSLLSGLHVAFDTTFIGLVASLSLALINMLISESILKLESNKQI